MLKTAGRWPWKSESAKECVTTHLPKQLALKMDDAKARHSYPAVGAELGLYRLPRHQRVGRSRGLRKRLLGVNLAGAAPCADLGGSSKYSRETPGRPTWRRVSCEQPLNTSQSILRLRGSLDQTRGVTPKEFIFFLVPRRRRKGIQFIFWNLVVEPIRTLISVVATRHDQETPAGALGRVVFSA